MVGVGSPGPVGSPEDLSRRWVDAWTTARGLAHVDVLGWPRVLVGSASRETELVCADPDSETWSRLVATIAGDPRAMLTVVSPEAASYVADLSSDVVGRVRVDRDDETLMTRSLPHVLGGVTGAPPGYEAVLDTEGGLRVVRLVRDESVAAEGTVGVHGRDATYDAIETVPRHRRRGLARWVMTALDAYAVQQGATVGLLVATPDGARLYRSLGWESVAPMRSLMGVVEDGPDGGSVDGEAAQGLGSDWTTTKTSS